MALVAERWGLVRPSRSRLRGTRGGAPVLPWLDWCQQYLVALASSRAPTRPCDLQIPALREFAASGRPIWGTCAGLIFLADNAVGERFVATPAAQRTLMQLDIWHTAGQKQGGQALIGGLDITVSRNFFGSQIESFETHLASPAQLPAADGCVWPAEAKATWLSDASIRRFAGSQAQTRFVRCSSARPRS